MFLIKILKKVKNHKSNRSISSDVVIAKNYLNEKDYIYISAIAKAKSYKSRVADVIRNKTTLDWNNYIINVFESEHFRKQVGLLTFMPSVTKWCENTNVIEKLVKLFMKTKNIEVIFKNK